MRPITFNPRGAALAAQRRARAKLLRHVAAWASLAFVAVPIAAHLLLRMPAVMEATSSPGTLWRSTGTRLASDVGRVLRARQGCHVYTYYDAITEGDYAAKSAAEASLVKVWKRSWRARGWDPVVLSADEARRHPRFAELHARFKTLPTGSNPEAYEMACFLRWLAVAAMGGGYMTDYDAVNVGLPSPAAGDCVGARLPNRGRLTLHEHPAVPSLVTGDADEYVRVATAIAAADWRSPSGRLAFAAEGGDRRPHVSDMKVLAAMAGRGELDVVHRVVSAELALVPTPRCRAQGRHVSVVHFSHRAVHVIADARGLDHRTVDRASLPSTAKRTLDDALPSRFISREAQRLQEALDAQQRGAFRSHAAAGEASWNGWASRAWSRVTGDRASALVGGTGMDPSGCDLPPPGSKRPPIGIVYIRTHGCGSATMASIVFRHAARYGLLVAQSPGHFLPLEEARGGGDVGGSGEEIRGRRDKRAKVLAETSMFHHTHIAPSDGTRPRWEAMLDWYQAELPGVPIVIIVRNPIERYARAQMGDKPTMLQDLGIEPTAAALEAFIQGAQDRVFMFIPLDKFDEGLVALGRRLGWHPRDLAYVRLNAKSPPAKPVHSPAEVRRSAALELQLYKWAAGRFEAFVNADYLGREADRAIFDQYQQKLADACWTPGVAPRDAFTVSELCRTYAMNDIEFWRTDLSDEDRERNTGFEGHVHRGRGGRVDTQGITLLE